VFGVILILVGISVRRNDSVIKPGGIKTQETVLNSVGESASDAEEINTRANQDAFEQYVTNKFSTRYFNVARIVQEEDFAFSNLRADFNISEKSGSIFLKTYWIQQYTDHTVTVASTEELDGYNFFNENNENPMFKILGIGGKPDNPSLLYMIPAKEITTYQKQIFEITPFKKEDLQKNFFFYLNEKTLK
jgi:hypothetical protein